MYFSVKVSSENSLSLNGTSPDGVLLLALHNVLEPQQARKTLKLKTAEEKRHPHINTVYTHRDIQRTQTSPHNWLLFKKTNKTKHPT